jgi:6-phosphogluconate dehydrogenase (decarboxylating)
MTATPAHLRSIVDHDGAVILDILGNRITTLNTTGAYIWARLQEGRTTDSIVAELARHTEQEVRVVETDVHEFLEQLKRKRLLNV